MRLWAALMLAALPGPAAACRLALVLALDVSASVDEGEYLLQRNGLAAALIAPEVEIAFLSAPAPVALAAFQSSGKNNQLLVLDWRLIRTSADLLTASETIVRAERSETEFPTAMGFAMGYAAGLFRQAPDCARRTIDVSGDGESNDGFPPRSAYRHFPLEGVAVNVLAIGGAASLGGLVDYFRDQVIRGPGAFVETAVGFEGFESAMRRKLEREAASLAVGRLESSK